MASNFLRSVIGILLLLAMSIGNAFAAGEQPKTPDELAKAYIASFNKKDKVGVNKLRYPTKVTSEMQTLMDEMADAEMSSGTQYTQFEVKAITEDTTKGHLGPDGVMYVPVIKPTHVVKFTAKTENGSSSMSMPIGPEKGVYYIVTMAPSATGQPVYKFGWQKATMPGTTWSVLLPNEPEPGRAALESEGGPDALKDPDVYGVVKNTASFKTAQHWFWCGAEGKRVNAPDNREHYRAACTTYAPETLKEFFPDPKKTLDETVQSRVRELDGTLLSAKETQLNGAPGRVFEIKGKDGKVVLGRTYWVNNALYELTVDSKDDKVNREAAEKFLNSLEVK